MRILLLFLLSSFFVLPLAAQDMNLENPKLFSPEEFYMHLKSAELPLIIDARTWKEYKKDRIPGAKLTESSEILRSVVDSCDSDYAIFVYCNDNQRSSAACSFLRDWGYKNVSELAGGMMAWKLASYEIDTEKVKRPDR
jgi:rhodanese-related sulfurtransferase